MNDKIPVGKLAEASAGRDAIHVAIAPVTAPDYLDPGQHVDALGHHGPGRTLVGIVDPFLTERVKPGERFYVFLYPNTVTSLRHVWTHPAFLVRPPAAGPEAMARAIKGAAPQVEKGLDPTCGRCGGTGVTHAPGAGAVVPCSDCRGTGLRRAPAGAEGA